MKLAGKNAISHDLSSSLPSKKRSSDYDLTVVMVIERGEGDGLQRLEEEGGEEDCLIC